MSFIKNLFSFLKKKLSKKFDAKVAHKSSKIYALERLKEIHNYDYSTFIANYYRSKNYTVWEYSKERNLINHPLNLVTKREKDILLIECRSNITKITLDNLLEFEQTGIEFVAQYALFKNYNIIYLCICSEDRFSEEALTYIVDNSHISYEILKEFDV
ncbi:MAG: hypothetical protein KAG56_06215 [Sulfurovaceae bacterium]|nr:hypothetical protein [Sulfurovaceae bacterium]